MIYTGSISKDGVKGVGYIEDSSVVAKFVKQKGKNQFVEIAKLNAIYERLDSTDVTNDNVFVRGKNGVMYPFMPHRIFNSSEQNIGGPAEIYSGLHTIKDGANTIELEGALYRQVGKAQLLNGKTHFCENNGEFFEMEQSLYSQTAFMSLNSSGKGAYVRANDGSYVEKSRLEIPAYKKVNLPQDEFLDIRNGVCYIRTNRRVILPSGEEIKLPNENVSFNGEKWLYFQPGQQPVECQFKADEKIVEKFLYNNMVVDGSRVSVFVDEAGETASYTVRIGNKNQTVGQINAELTSQIVSGSTSKVESFEFKGSSLNQYKQTKVVDNGRVQPIIYTFPKPEENGITRVEVNKEGTRARFFYEDKIIDYVISESKKEDVASVLNGKPLTTKYVKSFNFEDLRDIAEKERQAKGNLSSPESQKAKREAKKLGVRFDYVPFENNQTVVASQVVLKDNKISSFYFGDEPVTDIVWVNDKIVSYKFRGYDIEFKDELCTVKKDGIIVAENVTLNKSKYSFLAIEYKLLDKIENVKWAQDGTIFSFKLGEYSFSNISWNEGATIEKCDIKIKGKTVKNVTTEDLFYGSLLRQLQFRITAQLTEQKFMPLLRTALFKREGESAKLNADVVAGKKENGIAEATELTSMEQALKLQKNFSESPYSTHYEDENGEIHKIENVTNTYDAKTEFVNEQVAKTLKKLLGTDEISYKKGKITIKRSKDTQKFIDDSMYVAAVGASSIIGIPIAVPMLVIAGIASVADKIKRGSTKHFIKNLRYDDLITMIQQDAQTECKTKINELVQRTSKAIDRVKTEYSSAELPEKLLKMQADFLAEYNAIASTLEMLQTGEIQSKFDLGKGGKIEVENLLAFLFTEKKQEELKYGKAQHPDFEAKMQELEKSMLEKYFLEQVEDAKKEEYNQANKQRKLELLKIFKQELDAEEKKEFKHFERTKKIELLEKLGGARGYREAHKIRMANLEEFYLNSCSAEKRIDFNAMDKKGKKAVLKDYKKRLEGDFAKGKAKWGSIDEKVEAFKNTDEYRLEVSSEKRKKMLDNYRESMIKELNAGSTSTIGLEYRFEDESSKATRDGLAVSIYREMCLGMFNPTVVKTGNPLFEKDGKTPKAFDYTLVDKLDNQDKIDYDPKAVHGLGSTIIGGEDKKPEIRKTVDKVKEKISTTKDQIEQYVLNVQRANNMIDTVLGNSVKEGQTYTPNYMDILRAWATMEDRKQDFEDASISIQTGLKEDGISGKGVVEEFANASKASNAQAMLEDKKQELDKELKKIEAEYDEQKEISLREGFIKRYTTEFKQFSASKQKENNGSKIEEEDLKTEFIKKEVAKYEVERRRVDFRARLKDEVFISLNRDSFARYVEEVKKEAQKKNGYIPTEDVIRCMFVEYSKVLAPEVYEGTINSAEYKSQLSKKLVEYFNEQAKLQSQKQQVEHQDVEETEETLSNASKKTEHKDVDENDIEEDELFLR